MLRSLLLVCLLATVVYGPAVPIDITDTTNEIGEEVVEVVEGSGPDPSELENVEVTELDYNELNEETNDENGGNEEVQDILIEHPNDDPEISISEDDESEDERFRRGVYANCHGNQHCRSSSRPQIFSNQPSLNQVGSGFGGNVQQQQTQEQFQQQFQQQQAQQQFQQQQAQQQFQQQQQAQQQFQQQQQAQQQFQQQQAQQQFQQQQQAQQQGQQEQFFGTGGSVQVSQDKCSPEVRHVFETQNSVLPTYQLDTKQLEIARTKCLTMETTMDILVPTKIVITDTITLPSLVITSTKVNYITKTVTVDSVFLRYSTVTSTKHHLFTKDTVYQWRKDLYVPTYVTQTTELLNGITSIKHVLTQVTETETVSLPYTVTHMITSTLVKTTEFQSVPVYRVKHYRYTTPVTVTVTKDCYPRRRRYN